MNTIKNAGIFLLFCANLSWGHGDDNPLLSKLIIDKAEIQEDDIFVLESELWVGKDLNKAWFKADWETVDGETETAELQALYSKAIAPNWDLQLGWRHDAKLDFNQAQNWSVIGLRGLTPYYFDVDAALFVGDGGDTALRLEAEYELLLTQRLVVIPEIELDFHGQNNDQRNIGSGLSAGELSLHLAYHLRREIAPYIGFNIASLFGKTADIVEADGEKVRQSSWVLGLKLWF